MKLGLQQIVKEDLYCCQEFSIRAKLPSSLGFPQGREQPEVALGKIQTVNGSPIILLKIQCNMVSTGLENLEKSGI